MTNIETLEDFNEVVKPYYVYLDYRRIPQANGQINKI